MTLEQILSLCRHGLSGLAGVLIAFGILDASLGMEIIGAITGVTAAIWSIYAKRDNAYRMVEGAIRQLVSLAMACGAVLTPEQILQLTALGVYVANTILGQTDKLDK